MTASIEARAVAAKWLVAFERAVRLRDFDAGRALFAPSVIAFGSVVPLATGIDALEAEQWRRVWPNIESFAFDHYGVRVFAGSDDALISIATTWTSIGVDAAGRHFARPGRVTLVLERQPDGAHLCAHSHYSLAPGTDTSLRG